MHENSKKTEEKKWGWKTKHENRLTDECLKVHKGTQHQVSRGRLWFPPLAFEGPRIRCSPKEKRKKLPPSIFLNNFLSCSHSKWTNVSPFPLEPLWFSCLLIKGKRDAGRGEKGLNLSDVQDAEPWEGQWEDERMHTSMSTEKEWELPTALWWPKTTEVDEKEGSESRKVDTALKKKKILCQRKRYTKKMFLKFS